MVLCGLGGAGKTSLAVEYAYRHLAAAGAPAAAAAGAGVAWQFAAEDPAVLAAGFGELAAQLGARDLADTRNPVASVHGVLAAYPREWLLVLDNATDRASVEAFLPPAGPGLVLVTSQNPNWPPSQVLDVPVLAPDASADFLAARTGDSDARAAAELAAELGGLPLALEQAAAYVQATGGSLAAYLTMFRQRRDELLARGEPTGYRKTVATAWSLAFGRLEHSAPAAVALMRLLACCAPEAIPLGLLLQPRPGLAGQLRAEVAALLEDPLLVSDAIAALRRYSLITPVAAGSVSVHPLVQAVTSGQLPPDQVGQWRQAAATVIEAAIPADTNLPETWSACAALLPHAQVALADNSAGLARLANYVGERGNYAAALDLHQRIVKRRYQAFGPLHPDSLIARANLAYSIGEAGDPAGARDEYAALLPFDVRAFGPEHRETLATRANLGRWTGGAGDPAAACEQLAELLPTLERVLGPEHPLTLITRDNLAVFTAEAGDAAAARDQYATLLPIRARVSGPEHPHTLAVRANLATATGQAGDAAGARDQCAGLLSAHERIMGPEHPTTLLLRANLAHWTGEAGDAAGARDLLTGLLPILHQVLGAGHPDTQIAGAALARWTEETAGGFHRGSGHARGIGTPH